MSLIFLRTRLVQNETVSDDSRFEFYESDFMRCCVASQLMDSAFIHDDKRQFFNLFFFSSCYLYFCSYLMQRDVRLRIQEIITISNRMNLNQVGFGVEQLVPYRFTQETVESII